MAREKAPGGMAAAAVTLERELERYEELARDLEGERLDSEKALRRAAQVLTALGQAEERLRQQLAELVAAIGQARERQQAQAAGVAARAVQVGERAEQLRDLFTRWGALGAEAAAVTEVVQRAAQPMLPADSRSEIEQRLEQLAGDARNLAGAAQAASFAELAKQAEGLRQQVLASLNRLRLAHRA